METGDANHSSLMASIKSSLDFTKYNAEANLFTTDGKLRRNINGEILQANEFYLNMAEDLEKIKSYWEFINEDSDIGETESVISDVMDLIARASDEPKVQQQIRVIIKLEKQLEESYTALKAERLERKLIHDQALSVQSESFVEEDSNVSLEIEDETTEEKAENEDNEKNSDKQQECAKNSLDDVKFIKRNIQLAKNASMATYSLTDEEKVTLGTLLSDVDNIIDAEKEVLNEDDNLNSISGFIFDEDEKNRMHELDTKLLEFSEENNSTTSSTFELIDEAEREGKHWKNNDRLKQIDDALRRLELEIGDCLVTRTEVDDELFSTPDQDGNDMKKYNDGFGGEDCDDSNDSSDVEKESTVGDQLDE